jgi:hypothetical protein
MYCPVLRHELSSLARTLRSLVRIPLEAWTSVCVYSVFVLFCVKVEALQRADSASKECYRLCIGSRIWKRGQGPTKGCRAIIIIIIIYQSCLLLPKVNNSHQLLLGRGTRLRSSEQLNFVWTIFMVYILLCITIIKETDFPSPQQQWFLGLFVFSTNTLLHVSVPEDHHQVDTRMQKYYCLLVWIHISVHCT